MKKMLVPLLVFCSLSAAAHLQKVSKESKIFISDTSSIYLAMTGKTYSFPSNIPYSNWSCMYYDGHHSELKKKPLSIDLYKSPNLAEYYEVYVKQGSNPVFCISNFKNQSDVYTQFYSKHNNLQYNSFDLNLTLKNRVFKIKNVSDSANPELKKLSIESQTFKQILNRSADNGLLWMGDLNSDSIPDIINISNSHEKCMEYQLFLSIKTNPIIIKKVSGFYQCESEK